MNIPIPPGNVDVLIGFALFIASELIGMSKSRSNSVLQLLLHLAMELFPYELQRREPATRANRPRVQRSSNGRFASSNDHADRN